MPLPIHSLSPFLVRGHVLECCRTFYISGVPSERYLWGVPADAGHYPYLPGEREGLMDGSRLQLSHGVAGKICLSVKYLIVTNYGILDAQILACLRIGGWRRLLGLS